MRLTDDERDTLLGHIGAWRWERQGLEAAEANFYAAVEAILTARLAEAWDEGCRTGSSRAMRKMSDEPNLPLASEADNPYRAALTPEATP